MNMYTTALVIRNLLNRGNIESPDALRDAVETVSTALDEARKERDAAHEAQEAAARAEQNALLLADAKDDDLTEAREDLRAAEHRIRELTEDLEAAYDRIAKLEQDAKDAQIATDAEVERLGAALDDVKADAREARFDAERDIEALEDAAYEAQGKIETLEEEVEALRDRISALGDELGDAEERIVVLECELDAVFAERDELRDGLAELCEFFC